MIYPTWLRDLFTLMSVTYSTFWDEAIADDIAFKSAQCMWYAIFKDYEPHLIQDGMLEAVKIYEYPPKPAQLLEIVISKQRLHRANEAMRIRNESRLLPRPPLDMHKVLNAKLEMWKKLGMTKKFEETMDEIARLDSEENGNRESHSEII
jgi:hypothetical protein